MVTATYTGDATVELPSGERGEKKKFSPRISVSAGRHIHFPPGQAMKISEADAIVLAENNAKDFTLVGKDGKPFDAQGWANAAGAGRAGAAVVPKPEKKEPAKAGAKSK